MADNTPSTSPSVKTNRIMSTHGVVRVSQQSTISTITIAEDKDCAKALAFSGPVTRCTIVRGTDCDLLRTARAQFAFSSFGQTITGIKIQGIQFAQQLCPTSGGTMVNITEIYNNYRISNPAAATKRLYIKTQDGQRYQCVVTDLQRVSSADKGQYRVSYTLSLLGVPYNASN